MEEDKKVTCDIPFSGKNISSTSIDSSKNEIDLIEKKRELKRWKESFSYYSLNPDKFKFGLRDL